ncbi:hypothetical protein V2J09_011300 [Rumex salicifolius]
MSTNRVDSVDSGRAGSHRPKCNDELYLWNCRGANKPNFRRVVRYLLKKFDVGILALFETHAAGVKADSICARLGFDNSFRVDAQGQNGGVWLLWRSDIGQITIMNSLPQFIHVKGIVLCSCEIVVAGGGSYTSFFPLVGSCSFQGNLARRPFQFEAAWLHHPSFRELLAETWNPDVSTPTALGVLRSCLWTWNREVFGNMLTIIRRCRSQVEMLRSADGRWIKESRELEELALGFYSNLYSIDVDMSSGVLPRGGFVRLSKAELAGLLRPFTPEEVEAAIREIGRFKAPGPDGFQPVFYQSCWDVVGDFVTRFVLNFFETQVLAEAANDALLVLIAKVTKPEKIE